MSRAAPPPAPDTPAPPNRPLEGTLWMLATGLCFVAVTGVVKHVGSEMPAAQAAFLRFALGLVFILPVLPALLHTRLSRQAWGLFSLRGVVHTAGVVLWFHAMTRIPLAEVTAINYLSPVFVAAGAALFLGERLAVRRIAAIGVALLGALVILRPGLRELTDGHLAIMGTALFFAGSYLIAKRMSGEISAGGVVAMLSILVTIGLAPFAWAVWVPPTAVQLGWMFVVALAATLGHYTMTRAFAVAPIAVTQPVTFLQLIWATMLGVMLFGEPVDGWVLAGGALIMAAVSFITWREAVLRRREITPASPATHL